MAASNDAVPFVTVVMPVRNEDRFIARSVGSVLAQDYPADRLEILAVDGRSTDGTRPALESMARECERLSIVDNPAGIVAPGLNAALRRARGDIVIRVDGHCEIASDYVRRCVAHLQSGNAEGVGGPLETVGETFPARAIAAAMSSRFGVGGSAFRTRRNVTKLTDTVAFPGYTREILRRAGPFDEELVRNQDDEYNYRLRALGARILLAADVRSRYWSRATLGRLWKQYFQYGYWKVRVLQKHPRQMKARQFVPPIFVAAVLVSAAASPFSTGARIALVGAIGAYAASNLLAATWTARTAGPRAIPLLAGAFAALHLSYGFGFLTGLVRFAFRWGDRETRVGRPVEEHS
ncbi:MAG TPA: glycosyltransferase family 2 protein [Thermoanaerobaculia bacterium]|jgi:glycosyltransferase involved in cell wall biosynthesis